MKSLAELITSTQSNEENWNKLGKEALNSLAKKVGVEINEHLHSLLLQAKDLARSELLSGGENLKDKLSDFWKKVEKNSVLLTKEDYLRAAVVALSFAHRFARTDYGSSRQRGFGQLWGDTIQGILGEIAFQKFMKWATSGRIIPTLNASEEKLEAALSTDVVEVNLEGKSIEPLKRFSIKTTKLNGRWLDIPYAQDKHSDIYVLVKIGTDADTLFNFLAKIGALEQVLKAYREGKLAESERVFLNEDGALERAEKKIKQMRQGDVVLLAFIAGWQKKDQLSQDFRAFRHNAQKARKKVTVYSGIGTISSGNVRANEITFHGSVPKNSDLPVEFYPIDKFSNSRHTLCSTDLLMQDLTCIEKFLSEEGAECA